MSGESLGDELGSGGTVVGVEAVGVRVWVRVWVGGLGVEVCCFLVLLGFSSRSSSASEGPRFSGLGFGVRGSGAEGFGVEGRGSSAAESRRLRRKSASRDVVIVVWSALTTD